MVAPIIIGGALAASIIAPPIIDWVGRQLWNKDQAENEKKLADAADYDRQQREEAAQSGAPNPYIPGGTGATQTNTTDPMAAMMPMLMMMMMIPLLTNMSKPSSRRTKEDDGDYYD
jgi:hypothetical protein